MNEKTTSVNWHAMDAEAVFERLDSGEDGLDEVKAKQRLESTGPNSLEAEEGVSPLRLLVRQVHNPLIYLMNPFMNTLNLNSSHMNCWMNFSTSARTIRMKN